MGFIPEDVIAQVLDRSDIVSVISAYIPLKPSGRNFTALCPFHHEKTPSFFVNPQRQIFRCFGCGEGGDAISFVMRQERLEFVEAVRLMAQRVGVEIPDRTVADTGRSQLRQQIKKINALAAEYYHQNLLTDKGALAKTARDYLGSRGINPVVAKKFRLGLALDRWDGLMEFLRDKGFSLGVMEQAGLIIAQTRQKGYYDRFRRRIMFPILDSRGEYVAFGGRVLPGDSDDVKYLNSPETPAYTKGENLYGFHWAKETIGRVDEVVVVEGYLDFIVPFAAGVEHVVASLGTALTVEQIRLIRRYTHNIVMLYDADPAGQRAMVRSLDLLISEGMNARVAALAEGEDPDTFVRKFGVERFREQVSHADTVFDFKLKYLLQQNSDRSIEARARISAEMLPTIQKFPNAVQQSEYIKRLAQALFVSPDALMVDLRRFSDGERRRGQENRRDVSAAKRAPRPVEESLIRVMLADSQYVVPTKAAIDLDDFRDPYLRVIAERIFLVFEQTGQLDSLRLLSGFSDGLVLNIFAQLSAVDDIPGQDLGRIHQDCMQRLLQERLRSKRRELRQAMEAAQSAGDGRQVEILLKEYNHLIKSNKGLSDDTQNIN